MQEIPREISSTTLPRDIPLNIHHPTPATDTA
jgi:hypothetical protein